MVENVMELFNVETRSLNSNTVCISERVLQDADKVL